eukprot:gnl/MRDRNA2_/MRDRNA2_74745_c0_seq2.p1 gnl/MRDRNA2_/MRDRNA2_74745_c0~~gnl/MRDRNA2_/MRDRNA2_74745_c0_seq2.p1  ORF type:complete len:518 (-),score=60.23 gnl/MRDRNA2_/MRDRNA2_74745_c0_seq2:217-1770(-)
MPAPRAPRKATGVPDKKQRCIDRKGMEHSGQVVTTGVQNSCVLPSQSAKAMFEVRPQNEVERFEFLIRRLSSTYMNSLPSRFPEMVDCATCANCNQRATSIASSVSLSSVYPHTLLILQFLPLQHCIAVRKAARELHKLIELHCVTLESFQSLVHTMVDTYDIRILGRNDVPEIVLPWQHPSLVGPCCNRKLMHEDVDSHQWKRLVPFVPLHGPVGKLLLASPDIADVTINFSTETDVTDFLARALVAQIQYMGCFDDADNSEERPMDQPEFNQMWSAFDWAMRQLMRRYSFTIARMMHEAFDEFGTIVLVEAVFWEEKASALRRSVPVDLGYENEFIHPLSEVFPVTLERFRDLLRDMKDAGAGLTSFSPDPEVDSAMARLAAKHFAWKSGETVVPLAPFDSTALPDMRALDGKRQSSQLHQSYTDSGTVHVQNVRNIRELHDFLIVSVDYNNPNIREEPTIANWYALCYWTLRHLLKCYLFKIIYMEHKSHGRKGNTQIQAILWKEKASCKDLLN